MNKIKAFAMENYFNPDFPMEYRIYMIFFIESLFISILSATTNTLLNKGIFGLVLQWGYILFCIVFLTTNLFDRRKWFKPQLLFMTFVYIPFLFFQTAGYDGTALLFSQLALFLISITFTGKSRIALVALNIVEYICCIIIQFNNPSLIIPHADPMSKIVDLIVALILSFSGLALLASYIAGAFKSKNDELQELIHLDSLTGIYNRRFLSDYLENQITSREPKETFYVMMMDIDHFKRINDTYGHTYGDEVLQQFVKSTQSVLRSSDVFARYGGEEFVAVIKNGTLESATQIAERIRTSFEAKEFSNDNHFTVSIGLVASTTHFTVIDILNSADEMLYKAKESGRNQVVVEN